MQNFFDVIVVGAGPVGMACALALFKRGFNVCVLEKESEPVVDQRAASIHPITLEMLDDLGVAEMIIPKGLKAPIFQYHDRTNGEIIAVFDLELLKDEFRFPYVLQYEQYKLTKDITETYSKESGFDALYSHAFVGAEQGSDHVNVLVETPNGVEMMQARYLVGADGGRSAVRRSMCIEFEGFTYDENFIKIATNFDFQKAHPEYAYRNFFSDPEEWCNLFKVRGERPEGLWRAVFPTRVGESVTDALKPESVERRMQKFFPSGARYHVEYCNVYTVSQMVAKVFRKGRICIAGDAAHVNNPIGGMGMNGGIHDAINLSGKIAQALDGTGGEDVLDLYSRQRRFAAVEYVQAQTIANKKLLEEKDLNVRRKNLMQLRSTADDLEKTKAFMRRTSLLESVRSSEAVT